MRYFLRIFFIVCGVSIGCSDTNNHSTPIDMATDLAADLGTDATINTRPDLAPDMPRDVRDVGPVTSVRLAHYNIEFLDNIKLTPAITSQAQAAVDVVNRFAPDIVVVNEFEVDDQPGQAPGFIANDAYARDWAEILSDAGTVDYSYSAGVFGNYSIPFDGFDVNVHDSYFATRSGQQNRIGQLGYGIASRYPIVEDQVRIITDFEWADLPGNMLAQLETNEGIIVPDGYPLFGKAVAILPFDLGAGNILTVVSLHATVPVGHVIQPYRNRDELLAISLLIDGALPGVDALPSRFVLMGDFNADPDHGDAFPDGILGILEHPSIVAFTPTGPGTVGVNPSRNTTAGVCPAANGPNPADGPQFQLDYLLPSSTYGMPTDGGMFYPDLAIQPQLWQLACQASNHMMLWADIAVR